MGCGGALRAERGDVSPADIVGAAGRPVNDDMILDPGRGAALSSLPK
jgi:hypothetical protein